MRLISVEGFTNTLYVVRCISETLNVRVGIYMGIFGTYHVGVAVSYWQFLCMAFIAVLPGNLW